MKRPTKKQTNAMILEAVLSMWRQYEEADQEADECDDPRGRGNALNMSSGTRTGWILPASISGTTHNKK